MTLAAPTASQQDALAEVANIGSGHAASMLARLISGLGVMVDVPRVSLVDSVQLVSLLGGAGTQVLAAEFSIDGGLPGRLFWVLPREDARRLAGRLLRRPTAAGEVNADETAALTEAANIVASACLTVVGGLLRMKLLPSPPDLAEGEVSTLLGPGKGSFDAIALEARFASTDSPGFVGQLMMVFGAEGMRTMLTRLGL
ncbi:MAG: Chemotaxis protein CheC --inhibitor of methylation [Myxococcaceae bacterium]|nr:Chemotaxis protein CheC --inhibitor of methylation [Myxococcaceae bacterium]